MEDLVEKLISETRSNFSNWFMDKHGNFKNVLKWHKVSVEDGVITDISLEKWTLVENRRGGKLLLEWLPKSIEAFRLFEEPFSGEISCTKLLKTLRQFEVTKAYFHGTLDISALPREI